MSTESQTRYVVASATVADASGIDSGDVDRSGSVDLADAIAALRVISGMVAKDDLATAADIDTDGRIGMAEAMHALKRAAGIADSD